MGSVSRDGATRTSAATVAAITALLLALPHRAAAGLDTTRAVILSPRLGAVIDSAARARFAMFEDVPGFVDAEIFPRDDGTFRIVFCLRDSDGVPRDSSAIYDARAVFDAAEFVEHFEGIRDTTYTFGSEPIPWLLAGRDTIDAPADTGSHPASPADTAAATSARGCRVSIESLGSGQVDGELLDVDSATCTVLVPYDGASDTAEPHAVTIPNAEITRLVVVRSTITARLFRAGLDAVGVVAGVWLALVGREALGDARNDGSDRSTFTNAASAAVFLGTIGVIAAATAVAVAVSALVSPSNPTIKPDAAGTYRALRPETRDGKSNRR